MPKRSRKVQKKQTSKSQSARDENQAAFAAVQRLMELSEVGGKNPMAVALGRRGGLKGGKARAAKMSKAERRDSARKAAEARWNRE